MVYTACRRSEISASPSPAAARRSRSEGVPRNQPAALAFHPGEGVGVKRFFFHLLKGRETVIDDAGTRLADLGAVVSEAERIAVRIIASEDVSAREWTRWKLDVKDEDGTRLFFFPFDEVSLHDVAEAKASAQQPGSAKSA